MIARATILPLIKAGNSKRIKLPNPRMVLMGAQKNRIFGIVTPDRRVADLDHIVTIARYPVKITYDVFSCQN